MKSISKFALAASIGLALTFTLSCSSDDKDDGDGVSSSSGGTQGGISSSSGGGEQGGGSSSSSVPSCGEYDPATQYCSNGTIKDYVLVPYEGQTYKTVEIGEQVWFAENLNYEVGVSKCYDNNPTNCTKYGRLYDWATAMALPSSCNSTSCDNQIQPKHKGICPSDWHIPSEDEWEALIGGYYSTAGINLTAKNGWENGNGTDKYGFSALPGGRGVYSNGSFGDAGNYGYWWSATKSRYSNMYDHASVLSMSHSRRDIVVWNDYRKDGYLFSVRCVKD
jgi:uncharacterized protein (TIGR02145 family)